MKLIWHLLTGFTQETSRQYNGGWSDRKIENNYHSTHHDSAILIRTLLIQPLTNGVNGVKRQFVRRAVISSITYELVVTAFDLFCVIGLLKCCILFWKKNIRNAYIYCTVLSGSAATQLRWGGRFYSKDLPWLLLIVTLKEALKVEAINQRYCKKVTVFGTQRHSVVGDVCLATIQTFCLSSPSYSRRLFSS